MCMENNHKPDRFLTLIARMARCLAFEESQRATSFVLIPQQVPPEQGELRYGASPLQIETRKQACTDRTDHCIVCGNACCRCTRSYQARSAVGIGYHRGPAGGTGTAEWSAAQGPPDRGERHPGQSQHRDGALAAV